MFAGSDGDAQLPGKRRMALQVVRGQRLLEPIDAQALQSGSQPESGGEVQPLVAVDQQAKRVADRLPDSPDPRQVLFRRPRSHAELDCAVALLGIGACARNQLRDGHPVRGPATAVDRHRLVVGADEAVERFPGPSGRRSQTAMSSAERAGMTDPRPSR